MNSADAGGFIASMLVSVLLCAVVAVLVGGLVVKLLVTLIVKFPPPYLRCCVVLLLSMLGGIIASVAMGIVISVVGRATGANSGLDAYDDYGAMAGMTLLAGGIGLAIGFVINAALVNWLLTRTDGSRMGLGLAGLVTLLQMLSGWRWSRH